MMNLITKTHQINSSCNESITIYPYKSFNNSSTRLEFQEKCVKLALKSSFQQDETNFLFVASAHVDHESNYMSLIIEQYDKGKMQFGNNTKCLMPTAPLPDAIYIPSQLIYQANLNLSDSTTTVNDDSIAYYLNSIKFLVNYFHKFCNTIDSINKIMSISSSIFYNNSNNNNTNLNASFDLITLGNCFDANRIQPISIIETSLLKTLQATSSFYLKPKTGYCALYKNENIILLMDSEPKANKLALTGIWVSGMSNLNHPLTWAACIRYTFSSLITNKSNEMMNSFILILFPSSSKRPEFYLCNPMQTSLEFTLLNGTSKFVTNKSNNENRYITIDLNEVKDGYNYKLFRNSLNQVFAQDVYSQHQMLSDFGQKMSLEQHSDFDDTVLSNSLSFTSDLNNDTDLQPRSLNTTLIQNKLVLIENNHKDNSNSSNSNNSTSCSNSNSSSASSSSLSSYPINFLQQQQQLNSNNLKKDLSNSTNGIASIGSYHSVSDISVLSDNDNDENTTSFFTNASSGIHTMSTQSYYSNASNSNQPKQQQNEYEFLRPKDPPPLPETKSAFLTSNSTNRMEQSNYNRNLYNSNNMNSLSYSSGSSSLSPSPTPSFNSSLSSGVITQQQQQPKLKSSVSNDPYDNSKSMLFGIPRDSPMPTIPSVNNDFHPMNLDSPFVDVTLNNCDDLSLYQPTNVIIKNKELQTQIDMRKTILKKQNENFTPTPILTKETVVENDENTNLPQQQKLLNRDNLVKNEQNYSPHYNQLYQQQLTTSETSNPTQQNHFLVSSNSNMCLSSSSSSLFTSSTPAAMKLSQVPMQSATNSNQQNPSFLMNNSLYSSISVSSNTSSNNSNHSNHSSNYSYNQQQSINLNSNNTSSNNEHLFNYNTSNKSSSNQFKTPIQNQQQSCNNFVEQLSSMHPQDIADLLMNNDEKLQSQLIEMNQLKETMNSLNSKKQKQPMLNNNSNTAYNNNSSDITSMANSISQLAIQIEERKNLIKNNLFNSFNSQLSTPASFKPQQQQFYENNQQRSNNSSDFNSSIEASSNVSLESSYKQSDNFQHYQPKTNRKSNNEFNDIKASNVKKYGDIEIKANEIESDDLEQKECENVFGATLKQQFNWQQQKYINSNSVSTLDDNSNNSILLQKFNYVSLLLDDYCDKNTSMNTKALAYKYLNKNDLQLNQNNLTSNYDLTLYSSSYYTPANTTLLSSSSSMPPIDTSKYDFNSNKPLFQYYTDNNNSVINTNATSFTNKTNVSSNNSIQTNLSAIDQQNAKFNSVSANQQNSFKNYENELSKKVERNENYNNQPNSGESNSDNEQCNRQNRSRKSNEDDDDDDDEDDEDEEGDIWLFGKPNSNSTKLPNQYKTNEQKLSKIKQKQRLQRQQRRGHKDKDFSDQDEPDRDVTHVLDIEKLKRLPKLL